MWKKVMAPTILLALLWLVVGGATIYYVNWLYHGHARDLAENLTTIQASEAMQDVLWRLQATVLEVEELPDGHTQREVAEWENAFETHLAEAERTTLTPEECSLVATIRTQFSQYRQCIHRRLGQVETIPASDRPTTGETARLAHEVAASCQRLLEIDKQLVARSTAQRSRLRAVFNLALLSLFLAGPAVGILYGMGIARRLHRSMTQISIYLQDAAGGLEHEVGRVEIRPSSDLPELQQQVQQVSHDLRDTLRRALNLVEGHAQQVNVAIREDFCQVPVLVEGDPGQLHQVFVNLLLNGIEAMPGGGELCVAAQDAAPPDDCCRVTVSDFGTGIAENILKRMFEPFVTSKERGTGLGLAISRRIIQQHGGKLTAANRQERGAVFSVELPRCSDRSLPAGGCDGAVFPDQQAVSDPIPYACGEAHDAPTAHH